MSVTGPGARVLHVTDTHLFAEPGRRQYGWDTRASLAAVLEAGHRLEPDLIVLGGDLAEDGEPATYQTLREHCGVVPTRAIPGNHDAPTALAATFDPWPADGLALGGWRLHGLSSWVADSEAGRVAEDSLRALRRALVTHRQPSLVFVHHPPLPVGHAGIDEIGLANGAEVLDLIAGFDHVRAVVCGHAHQSLTQRYRHLLVLGTPSTCRQFRPLHGEDFNDDRLPGLRVLDLAPDGALRSEVLRIPAAHAAAYRPPTCDGF